MQEICKPLLFDACMFKFNINNHIVQKYQMCKPQCDKLRIEHPYNCPSQIHEGIIDETRGRSLRDHLLFLSVSL